MPALIGQERGKRKAYTSGTSNAYASAIAKPFSRGAAWLSIRWWAARYLRAKKGRKSAIPGIDETLTTSTI
jgi:hypothetical protein